MRCAADTGVPRGTLGILLALKLTVLRNRVRQAVNETPLTLAVSAAFVLLIWLGLFGLFGAILDAFQRTPLERAVVVPVIFNVFFVALLVLLSFSNAILSYGSLFSGREPSFLLATPIAPVELVLVKYLESLFFASWSLILLGLPLMMAMARSREESWIFYPLFVAFFLFFVPIPGALGLLLAWIAARFVPRDGRRILMAGAGIALVLAAWWTLRVVHDVEAAEDKWTNSFFARMEFIEAAVLPSTWVTRGIEHTLRGQIGPAVGYLAVILANALLSSWMVVALCGRRLAATHDRARSSDARCRRGLFWANERFGGLCEMAFFYLPRPLRLIAGKDLRTFLRDPLQWSQLAVFLGLMVLYLVNLPRFYIELSESSLGLVVPFLNLCAITLILATFTSRFVFPLMSLEGQQLWLIGLLPMQRSRILTAKFAYALTITGVVSVLVTVLAAASLRMDWRWAVQQVVVILAVCTGLCGLAVGLGARLPMFGQTNAGRIANGFGGTVNLIASVGLVALVLAAMAAVTWRVRQLGSEVGLDGLVLALVGVAVALCVATGVGALRMGADHFARAEV